MKLLGRLNFTALVVSFAIGILMTYLITPKPKVVVKFPSPYNAGRVTYKDSADTCFVFRSDAVNCDAELPNGEVRPQPLLLEDFRAKRRLQLAAP